MASNTVVSIGSGVLDVLLKSKQFTPTPIAGELMLCEIYGGKADVEQAALSSGGAGTNTAVAFARQEWSARVIARLGSDAASQFIVDDLNRENVDTSLLVSDDQEQTGLSALLVAADGSRSALTFRGAAGKLLPSHIPFEQLKSVHHIHLSAIGNADLVRQILLFCMEQHLSLSWNPSKSELEEVVLRSGRVFEQSCQVIFMNDLEYRVVESAQKTLEQMAKIVVITRGRNGGDVYSGGQYEHYEPVPTTAVDETGAGDAFASGFMGALIRERSVAEATHWGRHNAANVVTQLGAKRGLLRLADFQRLANSPSAVSSV